MFRIVSPFFIPLLLILAIGNDCYSQDLDIDCFGIACGTVQANWELANGEAFVCEGSDFQLSSGRSTPLNNINEYQWYFVDKATGEVVFELSKPDTGLVSFNYQISDSLACVSDPFIALEVTLVVGSPVCGGARSCARKEGDLLIQLKPRARFEVNSTVCVGEEINLSNNSCHAEAFNWDFGDNSTSSEEAPSKTFTTPGTYTITLNASNSCGSDVESRTITVVGLPEADFDLTAFPDNLCRPARVVLTDQSNAFSNTRWEILPNDPDRWMFADTLMDLNTDNIEIIFKIAGDYTIRQIASNNCPEEDIKEEQITILEPPTYRVDPPPAFCDFVDLSSSDLDFSINGDYESIDWTFINADRASAEGASFQNVRFTSSGTVELRITSVCGIFEEQIPISVINTDPISFQNNPTQICNNTDTVQLKALPGGGQWEGLGSARNKITLDGKIAPSDFGAGTYEFSYQTGTGACLKDSIWVLEIIEAPGVDYTAPGVFCDEVVLSSQDLNFSAGGNIESINWTFENGIPNTASGPTFSNIRFSQSGSVIVRINGLCGILQDTIAIDVASTEAIVFSNNNPTAICQDQGIIQFEASPQGGRWDSDVNVINSEGVLDPENITPGTYRIRYQAGSTNCPNEASFDLEIKEAIGVQLNTVDPACESLNYAPQVSYSGEIDSYSWTFPGATTPNSNLPNPQNISFPNPDSIWVRIAVNGACGMASDSIFLEIQKSSPLVIEPVNMPICSGSSPIQLIANQQGGRWSGEGVDANTGLFDPSSVNPDRVYVIKYELNDGACVGEATINLEVVASATVEVQDVSLCIDSEPTNILASPIGGIWSGSVAIDSLSGLFDPALVPGPGDFNINYAYIDENNCEVNATGLVRVEALPIVNLLDTIELCLADFDASLVDLGAYSATPMDGQSTWSGPGIIDPNAGVFNPNADNLTTGDYTVQIQYERNDCIVLDSIVVRLIEASPLIIPGDTSICVNEGTLSLEANLKGGEWMGSSIDPNTGIIDLNSAGGGTFEYTYRFSEGTSCEQSASVRVEIIDLASQIDVGEAASICEGPSTYQFSGFSPTGGFWQGPYLLDSQNGTIDLSQITMDSVYTYQYCLESNAVDNCQACKPKSFILRSNPSPSFDIEGTACIGETFQMINTTQGGVNYSWDFGNGRQSQEENPLNTYTQKGSYLIRMEASDVFGCSASTSRELYVSSPPVVDFSLQEDEGCAPFEVIAINRSSGDSIQQRWMIGEDTILGPNLNDYFIDNLSEDAIIGVRLEVGNFCGTLSQVDSVLVRPYPQVRFGISEDEGCSPLTVDLINVSLGNPDRFEWDFGNGNNSTVKDPPDQTYFTSDTTTSRYNILLRAFNECGEDSLRKEITVFPPTVEAFIEMDTLEACQPLSLALESFSTPGVTLSWQFINPDGSIEGSEEEQPIHTFTQSGLNTIILFASACGTDSDTAQIEILPAPEVRFSHRPFVCVGAPVTFINESIDISGSEWSFGDGRLSEERSPSHIFDTAGTYTISLTAYSLLNNCPTTFTSTIQVLGNPQVAFQASEQQGCGPLTIDFSNETPNKEFLNFVWDFGDGSSNEFVENPSHTFQNPGNYQVVLTAYNADSCFADTSVLNIFVFSDPVSNFQLTDQDYCAGKDTILPINNSMDAVAFEWRVGESTSFTQHPSFPLNTAGSFEIELIVANSFQCRDTSRQMINVLESPIAQFEVDSSIGCEDFNVQFNQLSQFSDTYEWDFGNGNLSTDVAPLTIFKEPGVYQVSLRSKSNNTCPDDIQLQSITVYPKPFSDFEFQKTDSCGTPAEVLFLNRSQDNLDNAWDFADGMSSDETNPIHLYVDSGAKLVRLIVANQYGCKDTSQQLVDVFGAPKALFSLAVEEACERDSIEVFNTSIDATSFGWKLNGDQLTNDSNPTLTIDKAGVYELSLVAIYNEQCQDSLSTTFEVFRSPIADFNYQADFDPNILGEVQFSNQTIQGERFFWDLGDGQFSDDFSPYHEYLINRSISVQLTAYNDNGGQFTCTDTITKPVDPEWLATFFAPNALAPDLENDGIRYFKPVGTGLKTYEINIYSPWGTLVWKSTELDNGQPSGQWDGTYNGQALPQGAYTWVATMTFDDGNKQRRTGTVTIIR